jgi:riboflavin synthase
MGRLVSIVQAPGSQRFEIEAPGVVGRLSPGDSVAVSGTCLTATEVGETRFFVDATQTTLSRTTLGEWTTGRAVNLEVALGAGDPLGGHLVQGHVDSVGTVRGVDEDGEGRRLSVEIEDATAAVTVDRGSLTIDGVSLTVAGLREGVAEFAIIPYTWSHTTLRDLVPGARVNVEADVIGKYVQRLVEPYLGSA